MVWEVPPSLGYGESGVPGVVAGNETLVFDMKLVSIANAVDADSDDT